MKHLTYILLFISLSLYAQPEGMVLIEGYEPIYIHVGGDKEHKIEVPDSLTYKIGMRWKYEMKIAGIEFQEPLRKIDQIVYIERDYHYFGEIKDRTIYLNSALEEYPFCKRAAIVQMLFMNQGGKVDKTVRDSAVANFDCSERTENNFKKQYEGMAMYNEVKRALE